MIRTPKTIASASCDEIYALPRISITPIRIPPIIAPGIEPIPPITAAAKALIPGKAPNVDSSGALINWNKLANAARAGAQ